MAPARSLVLALGLVALAQGRGFWGDMLAAEGQAPEAAPKVAMAQQGAGQQTVAAAVAANPLETFGWHSGSTVLGTKATAWRPQKSLSLEANQETILENSLLASSGISEAPGWNMDSHPHLASYLSLAQTGSAVRSGTEVQAQAEAWLRAHKQPSGDDLGELKDSNPNAYALVKALLTKQQLGLLNPRHPASFGASKASEEDEAQPAADTESTAHVGHQDWLNWRPDSDHDVTTLGKAARSNLLAQNREVVPAPEVEAVPAIRESWSDISAQTQKEPWGDVLMTGVSGLASKKAKSPVAMAQQGVALSAAEANPLETFGWKVGSAEMGAKAKAWRPQKSLSLEANQETITENSLLASSGINEAPGFNMDGHPHLAAYLD